MPRNYRHTVQSFLYWLRHIKTWQLVVILVFGLLVCVSLLRMNSMTMDALREDVKKADVAGDKAQIQKTLANLQHYVSNHMNTSLGPGIYLTEEYTRARELALSQASNSTNPNAAVYQQASVECRAKFQGGVASFRNDYVTCVAERVKSLGVAEDPTAVVKLPQAEDYHHNFVTPVWSPDLAGFSVLFCVIITSVIWLRMTAAIALRLVLRRRFKSI